MTALELQTELNQESRDWANIGKFIVKDNKIILTVAKHFTKLYGAKVIERDITLNELDKANAYTVDDLMHEFEHRIITYK